MNDFVIETQIDKLIDLLNQRRKIALNEAARILNVKEGQVEQWAGTLEDKGIVELKYPVLGEPEIVLKGEIPKDLKVNEVENQEVKPEEVPVSNEEIKEIKPEEEIESKVENPYPEAKEALEVEEREIKVLSEKIANLEKKISNVTEDIDISKLKENLFEILIIISSLDDIEKITSYISLIERIVLVLKAKNTFEKTDKELMISTLKNVSENWTYAERGDIAKIFDEMVKKVETI